MRPRIPDYDNSTGISGRRRENDEMSKRKTWDDEDGEQAAAEPPHTSRAERTRATQAINKMAIRLAGLAPRILDQLSLPEELREAIDFCQSLKIRHRRRQQRVVCQLLRDEDHEAIIQRMLALDASRSNRKK